MKWVLALITILLIVLHQDLWNWDMPTVALAPVVAPGAPKRAVSTKPSAPTSTKSVLPKELDGPATAPDVAPHEPASAPSISPATSAPSLAAPATTAPSLAGPTLGGAEGGKKVMTAAPPPFHPSPQLQFGFLPIGLWYHALFCVACSLLLWMYVLFAWPKELEDAMPETPEAIAAEGLPPH